MREWFTRFPQKNINQIYLDNITRATKFFMDWFCNGTIPYTTMLAKMHKIVSDGYSGYTCNHGPLVVNKGFRGANTTKWYPILKKEWFTDIPNVPVIRPKIKNIPIEQSHWLQNLDEGYQLHLPDGKYVCNYLKLMSRLMNNLMDSFRQSPDELNPVTLANYMQLFVVGHPFEKINFSICMAQVNAILYMRGYKTLYHEFMDFECFLYDYDVIENKFVKQVNNEISQWMVGSTR